MQSLFTFLSPPDECGYLPAERWQLRYDVVGELTAAEYAERMVAGWRRFGHSLFRPQCPSCRKCLSIRVDVNRFAPSTTQKRIARANDGIVRLVIDRPQVTQEKLDLYDRYHEFQADFKGWPDHGGKSASEYFESFVDNPFPSQEWCYYIDDRLVGVGYVDALPVGLSAIYFFYEPGERSRSLGTWNVLSTIAEAQRQGLPHVNFGYYVKGCQSLEYKAKYQPNETLRPDGSWQPYLSRK